MKLAPLTPALLSHNHRYVIIDEADTMLSHRAGFLKETESVVDALRVRCVMGGMLPAALVQPVTRTPVLLENRRNLRSTPDWIDRFNSLWPLPPQTKVC